MRKLLYVKASPRSERSVTIKIADEFVKAYREHHRGASVDEVDLWKIALPEYDGDSAAAKMSFFGEPGMNSKQKTVYEEMLSIFERFNAADDYVFAIPLWNFGIPYKLKQYIDVLTMPKTFFDFDPSQGYIGLLKDKRATAIYTAGIYMPQLSKAYGTDHATPHFTDWLNFAGIQDVKSIWFYGNKMSPLHDPVLAFEKAIGEAREAATRDPASELCLTS